MKRDIVTAVICCYITTEFHFAKRDSRCLSFLGFSPCKWWEALVYLRKYLIYPFTHFDEPKNSLELLNPTRNIRICSTKLMTITSGEIDLQSKQDIICHVAKVKPATSAHYLVDVIPFLAYVIFPSNPTLGFISQWDSKDTIITRTTTFTFLVCKQSLLNLSSCVIYDYVILLIWKLAWDMPMNDSKGNEYHTMNNTIDKQLSSLKVKIYFFAMSKGQAKLSR